VGAGSGDGELDIVRISPQESLRKSELHGSVNLICRFCEAG